MALNLRAGDFLQAFLKLLPRGRVWSRDLSSVQNRTLLGLNKVYETNTARANQLLVDVFPGSTYELLPEWEATLGLPDPCAGPAPTVQARRAQVVARLVATGGQSIPYFTTLAKNLGYEITITQFMPSRFGKRFGTPFGGADWAHSWQVNAPTFTVNRLRFGDSFGGPFAYWNNNVLQCELLALRPAHTVLNFSYSE
ncbi:YmfQ family protein [Achromobacter veterisilvae]|uniref:YmfQ family protein n=1 Tax=Achromobacter veterisilvae TaxID=2069367 RepID=UPI00100F8B82|nr:YmfQ family protein [Achromobacter veterisilvae]